MSPSVVALVCFGTMDNVRSMRTCPGFCANSHRGRIETDISRHPVAESQFENNKGDIISRSTHFWDCARVELRPHAAALALCSVTMYSVSGKTMLAKRVPTTLPQLITPESIEDGGMSNFLRWVARESLIHLLSQNTFSGVRHKQWRSRIG
jgi:hypothetical protein